MRIGGTPTPVNTSNSPWATDVGSYSGAGISVTITGTERIDSATGPYWHFARRQETCQYFSGGCGSGAPELSYIYNWAYSGGVGGLSQGISVPAASVNGTPIVWSQGTRDQKLVALGIYLHSLADSYSHEACMQCCQLRTHVNSPAQCNARTWHINDEFGPGSGDIGVSYTTNSANQVWSALKTFASRIGAGTARMSDADASSFINNFATTDDGDARKMLAQAKYRSM